VKQLELEHSPSSSQPRMCTQNLTLAVQPVHLSRASDDVYNGVIRLSH
jgi:hypothetical protein